MARLDKLFNNLKRSHASWQRVARGMRTRSGVRMPRDGPTEGVTYEHDHAKRSGTCRVWQPPAFLMSPGARLRRCIAHTRERITTTDHANSTTEPGP
jgi:hypothetical protein